MIREAGAGMVMLIGVQSNQVPRALDIARPLREQGIQVGIGGFHVSGTLKPLYNYMDDLPGIEGTPIPLMAVERAQKTAGGVTSFDAGRGCPYQCSFCTVMNVQGRKSRRCSPEDVEKIVRVNYAQGLRSFFITDDNFARNKDWEIILDRLIHPREVEKLNIGFIIQVDTLCHRPVRDDEAETHELFLAQAFIGHQEHVKEMQGSEVAKPA